VYGVTATPYFASTLPFYLLGGKMTDPNYRTRRIELSLDEIEAMLDEQGYDAFLDIISTKHCGNDLLMDLDLKEVTALVLDVTGDISEAAEFEDFIPDYGEETVWDMRRDEPEAYR
jgi:hypothetical protein